jgi:anti-sigma regulatory factor (Ser/Thr protein kinase)
VSDDARVAQRGALALDRTVPAVVDEVRPLAAEVRGAVTSLTDEAVLDDARLDDVEQATAEVLANAVEHGSGSGGHVRVEVEVRADEVVVRVTDAGLGEVPSRSQVEGLDPATSGAERGRGLWLLYRLADRASFSRTAGGRITEVGWRRPSAPAGAPRGET